MRHLRFSCCTTQTVATCLHLISVLTWTSTGSSQLRRERRTTPFNYTPRSPCYNRTRSHARGKYTLTSSHVLPRDRVINKACRPISHLHPTAHDQTSQYSYTQSTKSTSPKNSITTKLTNITTSLSRLTNQTSNTPIQKWRQSPNPPQLQPQSLSH